MLTVVGLSHRTAPVELREQVAVADADLEGVLRALGSGVVLSTCNRTEVYQSALSRESVDVIEGFLAARAGCSPSALRPYLYQLSDERAARHLFAVAAGLDSMVLGENQVLGQVRQALISAEVAHSADEVLSRVFRSALRCGKRARSETFIGRHAVSVSYAAVELGRAVFGQLHGCRALVVGAGETAELTTRTLVDHGVGVVAVANRTFENARALAARFGGDALSLDQLVPALGAADIVISSTYARGYVISAEAVEAAVKQRDGRPLFLIDIAVPRDVDPRCRSIANVHLYDIDDLKARCDHNRIERQREVRRVQDIIDSEITAFMTWSRSRQAIPTVISLRERAEEIRRAELAEALARIGPLDEAQQQTLDALTRAIINKLLHHPTVHAKARCADGDGSVLPLIRELFALDPTNEELVDLTDDPSEALHVPNGSSKLSSNSVAHKREAEFLSE